MTYFDMPCLESLKKFPKSLMFRELFIYNTICVAYSDCLWQDFETENLRMECHKRNKDFYVIYDIAFDELQAFIDRIENGFSSFGIAKRIADKIMKAHPVPCELHICDGDKTIIRQDSFRACTGGIYHSYF